jgi:hypothetical protein
MNHEHKTPQKGAPKEKFHRRKRLYFKPLTIELVKTSYPQLKDPKEVPPKQSKSFHQRPSKH